MSLSNILSIGNSALNTYSTGINIAAHNIANINTKEFKPQRVHYADISENQGVALNWVSRDMVGSNDLAREMVDLIMTQRSYEANAVTIRVVDEMMGTLLNVKV